MASKIKYQEGDIVGICGISFIKIIAPYVNPVSKGKMRKALFRCGHCGNKFTAIIGNVKKGTTTSCGCVFKAMQTTHNLSKQKTYWLWNTEIQRCTNPKNPGYHNYGARGISMYKLWMKNFLLFHNYIINLPNYGNPNYVLDRENNDKGYEPGNLRWVTYHTSNLNKRPSKLNTSGYIGVGKNHRCNSYFSKITINRKVITIINSPDILVAAKARDNFIKQNNLTGYNLNFNE